MQNYLFFLTIRYLCTRKNNQENENVFILHHSKCHAAL